MLSLLVSMAFLMHALAECRFEEFLSSHLLSTGIQMSLKLHASFPSTRQLDLILYRCITTLQFPVSSDPVGVLVADT